MPTHIHALGAAALLSLLAMGATQAQDSSSASSSAMSSSEASSQMSSEPSSEPAKDNYGTLISTLQAGKGDLDLSAITDVTVINVVTVSSLMDGNAKALDNAIDKSKATVDGLRTTVAANAALSAKLTAAGYAADDVLAVVIEADGSATVYVDDRA